MADLIIRGMGMPIGCFYCPIGAEQYFTGSIRCPLLGKGVGYFDEVKNKRDMNCPLVPLPKGHGRIVDAAEILEKANNSPWFDGDVSELGLLLGSEVTTIVPAEGGTDDVRRL